MMNNKDTEPTRREEQLALEVERLKERLREAEEIINAIREGQIDGLVAHGPSGEQVYTLKTADQGYRALVESMGEGAALLSRGDVFYCNRRFADMLKLPSSAVIGTRFTEWIPPEQRATLEELPRNIGTDGNRLETSIVADDDSVVPVRLTLSSLSVEGFSGVTCVLVTDLTDRKRVEEALRKNAAELAWKNRELEEFASVAAHDLQEPLRKIQAFGDVLRHELPKDLPEAMQDYLSRMTDAASRMRELIKALLAYSRVSTKASPFKRIDLKRMAEKVIRDLAIPADERQPVIEIGDLPAIEADPIQISQLLQNLVGNAIRYVKNGQSPAVKISGRKIDQKGRRTKMWLELRVQDDGIGFDMQYLDKIFKPFERLHGRSKYGGTGMGLAICKRITERHGGTITAESKPGEGATFIVTLPMRQTDERTKATN